MILFITVGGFAAFIIAWLVIIGLSGSITNTGSIVRPYSTILSVIVGSVLLWLIYTPFSYGVKWYKIQQVRGQSVPARGIFSCYMSLSRLMKVIQLSFIITVRKLCVIIPAAAFAGAAYYILANGGNIILYCTSASFMLIAAVLLFLYLIMNIRYALVSYIYVLKPDISIKILTSESRRLLKGRIVYCLKILLSVSWLIIPCLMIFPAVFIVPYIQMVYTAMINEIIRQEESYADYESG